MMEKLTFIKENFDPLKKCYNTASDIIVPTSDGIAVSHWIRRLMRSGFPALVIGPSGSGKRTCIQDAIYKLEPIYLPPPKGATSAAIAENKRRCLTPIIQSNMLSLKSMTTTNNDSTILQLKIRNHLFSNGHGILGPGSGYKQVVLFLEDVAFTSCASAAVVRRSVLIHIYIDIIIL